MTLDNQSPPDLSVIVPVFKDNPALVQFLEHPSHKSILPRTLIVLGENDKVAQQICRDSGVDCMVADKAGRAFQMNAGAEKTTGDLLLFLHVDSLLPIGGVDGLLSAIRKGAVGGAFSRRFADTGFFLKLTCILADWRGRAFGWFLGDQGIFVTRNCFERIGGFPLIAPFEDLELSLRMRKHGRTVLVTETLWSSGRRFESKGALRQTWQDLKLTCCYLRKRKTKTMMV